MVFDVINSSPLVESGTGFYIVHIGKYHLVHGDVLVAGNFFYRL